MSTYRVILTKEITFTVDVEAGSAEEAKELAEELAPPPLCHQCIGSRGLDGEVNDDDSWEPLQADVVEELQQPERPLKKPAAVSSVPATGTGGRA